MVNVLHVVDSMDPVQGGPPAMISGLTKAQRELGCQVRILARDVRSSLFADSVSVDSCAEVDEVEWGRRELLMLARDADIVHVHGIWLSSVWEAIRAAKACFTPYVVSPHGMLNPWSMEQKRGKKLIAWWLVWRHIVSDAGFVHALNTFEKKSIEELSPMARVRIFPNGITPSEYDDIPPPGSFYSRHPELQGNPYILFLGRLHEVKGIALLLEAFRRLSERCRDLHLVIAGPDYGAGDICSSFIRDTSLGDRVHRFSPVYGEEKKEMLVDATCFCLPSQQEGFSMAILEALVCGVPIVISRQCHFPEVEENAAGYIVERDADHIAQAIVRLLENEGSRMEMAANARQMVMKAYTWPIVAADMVAAYTRCIANTSD